MTFMLKKTPAKAFTPPAEKKMDKRWSFIKNKTKMSDRRLILPRRLKKPFTSPPGDYAIIQCQNFLTTRVKQ